MRTSELLAAAVAALALGCSKPAPPTFVPFSVTATSVTPLGVELAVGLNATNPNDVALTAKSVEARVTLAGLDLGEVDLTQSMTLPPKKTTSVKVPVIFKWKGGLPDLLKVVSIDPVPFKLDGTVVMDEALVDVGVPFHFEGTVTHEDVIRASGHDTPTPPRKPPQ